MHDKKNRNNTKLVLFFTCFFSSIDSLGFTFPSSFLWGFPIPCPHRGDSRLSVQLILFSWFRLTTGESFLWRFISFLSCFFTFCEAFFCTLGLASTASWGWFHSNNQMHYIQTQYNYNTSNYIFFFTFFFFQQCNTIDLTIISINILNSVNCTLLLNYN